MLYQTGNSVVVFVRTGFSYIPCKYIEVVTNFVSYNIYHMSYGNMADEKLGSYLFESFKYKIT